MTSLGNLKIKTIVCGIIVSSRIDKKIPLIGVGRCLYLYQTLDSHTLMISNGLAYNNVVTIVNHFYTFLLAIFLTLVMGQTSASQIIYFFDGKFR